jgi:hypothetical protein
VLERGVDVFPAAWQDPAAMEIQLMADHRCDLVAERNRTQSRLCWQLVELDADLEARLPAGGLDRVVWLDRIGRAQYRPQRSRALALT